MATLAVLKQHRQARPTGKLAEEIASRIEAEIVGLGWPIGRVIGSEADFIRKYEVSRAVFREAVRLLEYHMVARMRPGPGGGLVVMEPNSDVVARAMALYLSYAGVGSKQLLEVRGVMEGHAAALVAANISKVQQGRLKAFLADECDHVEQSFLYARNFHLQVAEMSGNPVIALFVRCLVDLTAQQTTPLKARREAARRVNDVHSRVADAIISGDAELARRRMTKHVLALDPYLSAKRRRSSDVKTAKPASAGALAKDARPVRSRKVGRIGKAVTARADRA